jgi:zinc transporter 1
MARSPSPTARRHSVSHPNQPHSPDADHPPAVDGSKDASEDELLPSDLPAEDTPLLRDEQNGKNGHHGHSHAGSMNMRALVLHVIGDALGNVGVIATGLVIWLTEWSFKYYFDPLISLVITVIIFSSALPLGRSLFSDRFRFLSVCFTVRSASFILLQGVPPAISLDQVRNSILDVEGVLSLHELHIWQLSETKIVASVHVLASRDHDFMPVAAKIRKTLHHHGIHSSTIQPEYRYPDMAQSHGQLKVRQFVIPRQLITMVCLGAWGYFLPYPLPCGPGMQSC